ncbi:FecR family protein [Kordiimonas aquimaris]|uniref:FecR family protein n=1 Tax=Kordiimonas aquimaris TaxID=707591 RepID=UPI0021D1DA8A|nr:FecR domain-containing protein [Kordiimonas aquimaris]
MSDSEKIVLFPDLKTIEEEAALWIARIDARGELSESEEHALKDWVATSNHHREALERMAALWGGLNILDDVNYIDNDASQDGHSPATRRRPWWIGLAVAASLTLAVWTSFGPQETRQDLLSNGQFATKIGGQKTLLLSDGSTIFLNTNSEVTVALSDSKREINLMKGEAHFEVAHDPERPFLVRARGRIVKAVGTAFTVFLHTEAVEVTVTEGVVALIPQSNDSDEIEIDIASLDELIPLAALTAGQSAVFGEEVESLSRISADVLDRKLLWREGFIAFAGEPLSTVVADVSRYTDITIEIDDTALEALPIGGYFKVGEVEGMLDSLEASFGVRVDRINESLVRLSLAQ